MSFLCECRLSRQAHGGEYFRAVATQVGRQPGPKPARLPLLWPPFVCRHTGPRLSRPCVSLAARYMQRRPTCGPGAMPGARVPALTCARCSVCLLGTPGRSYGLDARPSRSASSSSNLYDGVCRCCSWGRCGRAGGRSIGRAGHRRPWARASACLRWRSAPDGATREAPLRTYGKIGPMKK